MFKSMLKKESTELAAPFLLAMGSLAILVLDFVNTSRRKWEPQGEWMLDDDFVYPFLLISMALAIVMGLVQSLSEDVQGTWRYVLALPGGWQRNLKLKLTCAAVVWLVWAIVAVTICLLGLVADTGQPGESLGKLTEPIVRTLFCAPVVYLGAFLTAIRRANWFFSRLMPLGGVLMCWYVVLLLPHWWLYASLATVGLGVVLVVLIFHSAAVRDFA